MLSILSFVIALIAMTLAAALPLLGWRPVQRFRQRLDELTETMGRLRISLDAVDRNWNEAKRRQSENDVALDALRTALEDLQGRFTDVEAYASVCVPQKPTASGLNINRRVEAVRMLQEGHRLPLMLRHIHGLYTGFPGTRSWRRFLGEQGARKGAGADVLRQSLRVFERAA